MSKEKKKFADTGLGKFLKVNAPKVLDVVDDYFPPVKIITELLKGEDLPPEIQKELAKQIHDYEKEIYAMQLEDTANARAMQTAALQQDDIFSKRYTYYLSAFIMVSAVSFGTMLFFVEFPETNRRLIEMLFDLFLFSGAITVINFFFGSSKGSADKTKMLK